MFDWIEYLFTFCPRYVRRMGYLYELIGINRRGQRERVAWAQHLEMVKKSIMESSAKVSKYDRVVVLGSGLLFDIPVMELSQTFKEVVLVDVWHLRSVKKSVKKHGLLNVRFITADISGVALVCFRWKKGRKLPDPMESLPDLPKADLVISANMISQLDLSPMKYIDCYDEEWGKKIVLAHIELMKNVAPVGCLIAEKWQMKVDHDGVPFEKMDMLWGVELKDSKKSWIWNLASYGYHGDDFGTQSEIHYCCWA